MPACSDKFSVCRGSNVVLCLLLLVMVAGCREQDDRVKLTVWHQKISQERSFLEAAVARYNQEHSDRVVEVLYRENEELRNLFVIASVGGGGPDLIFGPSDNVSIYALTESIMPVDRVLSREYLSQFDSNGLISWEGDDWMVADQVGNHLMLVYNKALLQTPPETIEEMITVLRALTTDEDGDGRFDRYGLTWNYREPFFFIPFLTCHGGWIMDEQGRPTLDAPATVKAIRLILDLRDKYKLIPASVDYDTAETLFKEQRSATIINGPWSWAGYAKANIDYGLALIPKLGSTGEYCAPIVSSKGYSVNVNVPDEKIPYVRHLMEYLTSPEMQTAMSEQLSTIPVIPAVRELDVVKSNPIVQASARQVEVSRQMPTDPRLRQVWDGMRGPYQLIMNGAVTPEEGARLMQADVEKRIKDTFL